MTARASASLASEAIGQDLTNQATGEEQASRRPDATRASQTPQLPDVDIGNTAAVTSTAAAASMTAPDLQQQGLLQQAMPERRERRLISEQHAVSPTTASLPQAQATGFTPQQQDDLAAPIQQDWPRNPSPTGADRHMQATEDLMPFTQISSQPQQQPYLPPWQRQDNEPARDLAPQRESQHITDETGPVPKPLHTSAQQKQRMSAAGYWPVAHPQPVLATAAAAGLPASRDPRLPGAEEFMEPMLQERYQAAATLAMDCLHRSRWSNSAGTTLRPRQGAPLQRRTLAPQQYANAALGQPGGPESRPVPVRSPAIAWPRIFNQNATARSAPPKAGPAVQPPLEELVFQRAAARDLGQRISQVRNADISGAVRRSAVPGRDQNHSVQFWPDRAAAAQGTELDRQMAAPMWGAPVQSRAQQPGGSWSEASWHLDPAQVAAASVFNPHAGSVEQPFMSMPAAQQLPGSWASPAGQAAGRPGRLAGDLPPGQQQQWLAQTPVQHQHWPMQEATMPAMHKLQSHGVQTNELFLSHNGPAPLQHVSRGPTAYSIQGSPELAASNRAVWRHMPSSQGQAARAPAVGLLQQQWPPVGQDIPPSTAEQSPPQVNLQAGQMPKVSWRLGL